MNDMSTRIRRAERPDGCEPRFSFIMIVLNGMPFIEYSIKSIYDFAHQLIIVEGAVENCMFAANPDGSSKDGTVEFIRSFPDPAGKITLVQGRWPEKCEMQNEALKYVTGDYVWLIDSDEVYKQRDLEMIKAILKNDPTITQVNFIPDNFWKGFDYIFVSSKFFEDWCHCRRLFKYVPGAVFTTHRPPTMVWPGCRKTTEQMHLLDGAATRERGIILYHYSYVLDKQVKQKIELYHRYGWGRHWNLDLGKWYEECFLKWTPWNRDEIDSRYPIWTGDIDSHTLLFRGTHPNVVIDYIVKDAARPANRAAMRHVADAVAEIKRSFPRQRINAIETGTIRSFHEKHFTTYHISCALGNRGSLTSVDVSADSIRISRQVCHNSGNIKFVHSDSIKYLKALRDITFHFALLGSVNDKNYIFEEFRLIVPLMAEGGILIVDDAGITRDGCRIDTSVAAQKGHVIWEFLRTCGVRPAVLETTFGHGTQLKIAMTRENLAKIERGFGAINGQTERLIGLSGPGDDAVGRSLPGNTQESIESIVWVRTDSIGDAVLSASMLPYIRRKHEGARIVVVCQDHVAELYEACPYVDEVVVFNRGRALEDEQYRLEITARLRTFKPQLSLNSVYSREALTDWFAIKCGAERRVAFDGDLCNVSPEVRRLHNQFYTELLPSPGDHKLELERHRDFLAGLGIQVTDLQPAIWTSPEDEQFAERVFAEYKLEPGRTVALFAGAQYDCRLYEGYGEALGRFCRDEGLDIIALGSAQDRDINQHSLDAAGVRSLNFSGRTSILQSAALLRRCRLAVGAETGLAHIACAVGTQNVILLGGGHFGRFMPYSPLTSVVSLPLECFGCNWNCRYQRWHCVKDLAVDVLAEAISRGQQPAAASRVFLQDDSRWNPGPGEPARAEVRHLLPAEPGRIEVIVIPGARPAASRRDADARPSNPLREAADRVQPTEAKLTVATSITPRRLDEQQEAIKSWQKLGFKVVSFNCAEEIESLSRRFPAVQFVEAKRDARGLFGKPLVYLDEILRYLWQTGGDICGIVNSDVHLAGDSGIVSFIRREARNGLVYGPRRDIAALGDSDGQLCETGFDFFFFDRSLIPVFPESQFTIGMPWWDHWMPLVAILNGFEAKRLVSPFAYHLRHEQAWQQQQWLYLAKELFEYLRAGIDTEGAAGGRGPWAALGRIFAGHHRRYLQENRCDDAERMSVGIILPSVLKFLEVHSTRLTYTDTESPRSDAPDEAWRQACDLPARRGPAPQVATRRRDRCDVSIILCTRDRAALLDRMLSSLEKAATGVSYEVIAVDGGSSDAASKVLRRHGIGPVYAESEHLGPGRHCWAELYNFGFSKARGTWAMYASDDIEFSAGSIDRAVDLLQRQRSNVAGGIFFYKNAHPTRPEWGDYGIDFTIGMKLLLNYGLVRLDAFRQVGRLDESYRFYCGDTDFCFKLYERRMQLVPLAGCLVTHNNLLDLHKLLNARASGQDIELCRRRWRHFVGDQEPMPSRLLWAEDLADAFNIPADLKEIDRGIESFWWGLAWFQRGRFAEAERMFVEAVKSRCDHEQVLWYLAMAAQRCGHAELAARTAQMVIRLKPSFEPALDLLAACSRPAEPAAVGAASLVASVSGPGTAVQEHSCRVTPAGARGSRAGPAGGLAGGSVLGFNPAGVSAASGWAELQRELKDRLRRFNKVVVWGLSTSQHTHSHIHRHIFTTLQKLGARAVFVDDCTGNQGLVEKNDLVISVDVGSAEMPIRDEVYYCLHNCPDEMHRSMVPSRNIRLATYTDSARRAHEQWDTVTFFDRAARTLYQPWATDLLAGEFKEPVAERTGNVVFWVGSIWNDKLGRGNVEQIRLLKDVLEKKGIEFVPVRGVSDSLAARYVRHSLIAPAIAGHWQVQNNYLPCRMWKNISYGQLGFSNVEMFEDIFAGCIVTGSSIEQLVDNVLALPSDLYRQMTLEQQQIVKRDHTYVNRLLNIVRAFECIENY